jgi:hypothetical protein
MPPGNQRWSRSRWNRGGLDWTVACGYDCAARRLALGIGIHRIPRAFSELVMTHNALEDRTAPRTTSIVRRAGAPVRLLLAMRFHFLRAACIGVVLAGCASSRTVKMYGGASVAAGSAAVVRPSPNLISLIGEGQDVCILEVDGVALNQADIDGRASVEIPPGSHRVTAGAVIVQKGHRITIADAVPLQCMFEAGMEYSVHCRVTPTQNDDRPLLRFWIEDESGQLVSSTD